MGCSHRTSDSAATWRHADILVRAAQAGRQRAAGAPLHGGQAGVAGDLIQPRTQRRASFEAVERPPGPQVCLLHQVFGIVHGTEHPIAVGEQLAPERLGAAAELPRSAVVLARCAIIDLPEPRSRSKPAPITTRYDAEKNRRAGAACSTAASPRLACPGLSWNASVCQPPSRLVHTQVPRSTAAVPLPMRFLVGGLRVLLAATSTSGNGGSNAEDHRVDARVG